MHTANLVAAALALALGVSLPAQDRRPATDERGRERAAARPSGATEKKRTDARPEGKPEARPEIDEALVAEIVKLADTNRDGVLDGAECARFNAALAVVAQRARAEREERQEARKDLRKDERDGRKEPRSDRREVRDDRKDVRDDRRERRDDRKDERARRDG